MTNDQNHCDHQQHNYLDLLLLQIYFEVLFLPKKILYVFEDLT